MDETGYLGLVGGILGSRRGDEYFLTRWVQTLVSCGGN